MLLGKGWGMGSSFCAEGTGPANAQSQEVLLAPSTDIQVKAA